MTRIPSILRPVNVAIDVVQPTVEIAMTITAIPVDVAATVVTPNYLSGNVNVTAVDVAITVVTPTVNVV